MLSQKIPTSDLHLETYLSLHVVGPEMSLQGVRAISVFEPTENSHRLTSAFNGKPGVRVLDLYAAMRSLKKENVRFEKGGNK